MRECLFASFIYVFSYDVFVLKKISKNTTNKLKRIKYVLLNKHPCIVDELTFNTIKCEESNIELKTLFVMFINMFFSFVLNVLHFSYNQYVIYRKVYNQ